MAGSGDGGEALAPSVTRSLLRERPLVFVADLEAPELEPADHHHLARSLRVAEGSPVTIGDGAGRWREASFSERPTPVGPIHLAASPTRPVAVAFAPVKAEKSDTIVQKLTELGVDRIVPVVTERSVIRWDEARRKKNLDRHIRIARESSMQSRRVWLPTVEPLADLDSLVDGGDLRWALADPDGEPMGQAASAIIVGPEGGFSPTEVKGRHLVALPGGVLRAGTAAVVAGTLAVSWR